MNKVTIKFNKMNLRNQTVDVTVLREGKFFRKNPELLEPTDTTIYLKEPDPEIVIDMEADPEVNAKLGDALENLLERFEKVMSQQSKLAKVDKQVQEEAKAALEQARTVRMQVKARGKVLENIKSRNPKSMKVGGENG